MSVNPFDPFTRIERHNMSNTELIERARKAYFFWEPKLSAEVVDALEAAEQKLAELLVAGQPQRRANRKRNAAQVDALKAAAWDEGWEAGTNVAHHTNWSEATREKKSRNPYRVQP